VDSSCGCGAVCGRGMSATQASRSANQMSRGCLSKKRMSEELADKVRKKWKQEKYYCKLCSGWHLTSGKKVASGK